MDCSGINTDRQSIENMNLFFNMKIQASIEKTTSPFTWIYLRPSQLTRVLGLSIALTFSLIWSTRLATTPNSGAGRTPQCVSCSLVVRFPLSCNRAVSGVHYSNCECTTVIVIKTLQFIQKRIEYLRFLQVKLGSRLNQSLQGLQKPRKPKYLQRKQGSS